MGQTRVKPVSQFEVKHKLKLTYFGINYLSNIIAWQLAITNPSTYLLDLITDIDRLFILCCLSLLLLSLPERPVATTTTTSQNPTTPPLHRQQQQAET
jgi:hypothetical protein